MITLCKMFCPDDLKREMNSIARRGSAHDSEDQAGRDSGNPKRERDPAEEEEEVVVVVVEEEEKEEVWVNGRKRKAYTGW